MPKRILLIDDEELLTKTFTLLLEKNGYEVCVAKNGQDAQIMAEEENFDLILCDIRMPGVNGVETIRNIKQTLKRKGDKSVPIIFMTGYADQKVEAEAKGLKPLAYIYKPFDNSELLEIVKGGLNDPAHRSQ